MCCSHAKFELLRPPAAGLSSVGADTVTGVAGGVAFLFGIRRNFESVGGA